jgi:RNA polymerase sigma factor (sigma-70 family)
MITMTNAPHTKRRPVSRSSELWYAPDHRIETRGAAGAALSIAEWIERGAGGEAPDEMALFTALHTCAYRVKKSSGDGEATEWRNRWAVIREYLVESNLGLVHLMIKRYRSIELDEDDLLSDGMYGLARAVEKFNPWRGYRFSTYACNVIARALMRRAKMSSGHHRRFPVQQDASFERPTPPADAEMELRVERLQQALHRNLGDLTELETMVLSRRFPDQGPRLTYEQIGDGIGLSKERVRQIQNVALGKLRGVLSEDPMLK